MIKGHSVSNLYFFFNVKVARSDLCAPGICVVDTFLHLVLFFFPFFQKSLIKKVSSYFQIHLFLFLFSKSILDFTLRIHSLIHGSGKDAILQNMYSFAFVFRLKLISMFPFFSHFKFSIVYILWNFIFQLYLSHL